MLWVRMPYHQLEKRCGYDYASNVDNHRTMVGESVEEQELRLDLQLEIEAVERYRRGVEICLSEAGEA